MAQLIGIAAINDEKLLRRIGERLLGLPESY